METFEQHLLQCIEPALASWQGQPFVTDIYAMYLQLSLEDDNIRKCSIHNICYLTHSHSQPELVADYGSRFCPDCRAGHTAVNACSPSLEQYAHYYSQDKDLSGDVKGRELRDAYLQKHAFPLNLSQEEGEALRQQSNLQWTANCSPNELSPEDWHRLKELTRRFDPEDKITGQLPQNYLALNKWAEGVILGAFFKACETVIRYLHASGQIENICKKPVPIGITFSNDVEATMAVDYVRRANPIGLSIEIEEWMRDETYEATSKREQLVAHLAQLPLDLFAQLWVEAYVTNFNKAPPEQSTPQMLQMKEAYLLNAATITKHFPNSTALIVPLLISQVEEFSSNATPRWFDEGYDHPQVGKTEFAGSLLQTLQDFGNLGCRDKISDAEVQRLHEVLQRLFDDSHQHEQIGMNMTLTARTLHAWRPFQYPRDKFGAYAVSAGRLLNWRDYGLIMNAPNAIDWTVGMEKELRNKR